MSTIHIKGVIFMLNENLRQHRKAKGWTQDELAERSGYSRSSIINWENGKRAPRTADIDKLAITLGISPRDLINDTNFSEQSDLQSNSDVSNSEIATMTGYTYWGSVLDKSLKLAETNNMYEINLVFPLLKCAYEALANVIEKSTPVSEHTGNGVSAYNGNHSSYTGNNITVETA